MCIRRLANSKRTYSPIRMMARFDEITVSLGAGASRRTLAKSVIGGVLGATAASLGFGGHFIAESDAKSKKARRTKKRRNKVTKEARCTTVADCGPCDICSDGACVSTCELSEVCVGSTCVDPSCSSDADCQPGQECFRDRCQCTTQSCGGCCDGDICQPGTTTAICGVGGAACFPCRDV